MKKNLFKFFLFSESERKKEGRVIQIPAPDVELIKETIGEGYSQLSNILSDIYTVMRLFPASEKHHDSEKGGLWTHSLKTAIEISKRFSAIENEIVVQNPLTQNISYKDSYEERRQSKILAFLAGLLHDVGKITEYSVILSNKNFKVRINPLDWESFVSLCRNCENKNIEVMKNAEKTGMTHAYLSAFLAAIILKSAIKNFNPEVIAKFIQAIALEHTDVTVENNVFLKLLRSSDSEVTSENIEEQIKNISLNNIDVYLRFLKAQIEGGRFKINDKEVFHIYIDKENNRVAINASIAVNSAMTAIRMTRQGIFAILRVLSLTEKQVVPLKISTIQKVKSIPAVILPLDKLFLDENFIQNLPECPKFAILTTNSEENSEEEKKKEQITISSYGSVEQEEQSKTYDDPIIFQS